MAELDLDAQIAEWQKKLAAQPDPEGPSAASIKSTLNQLLRKKAWLAAGAQYEGKANDAASREFQSAKDAAGQVRRSVPRAGDFPTNTQDWHRLVSMWRQSAGVGPDVMPIPEEINEYWERVRGTFYSGASPKAGPIKRPRGKTIQQAVGMLWDQGPRGGQ